MIEPFARRRSRSIITTAPKFYLFDVGVAGHVCGRSVERTRRENFGRALEHFILMELLAFRSHSEADFPIRYRRTRSGLEVDFVVGALGRVAIEVKGARVRGEELKGMLAYTGEHRPAAAVVVCAEPAARRIGTIDILPWEDFLERLWAGAII